MMDNNTQSVARPNALNSTFNSMSLQVRCSGLNSIWLSSGCYHTTHVCMCVC